MNTVKHHLNVLLEEFPDDCTCEDILYHLSVMEKVRGGIRALDEGKGIPRKEAAKHLNKWLPKECGSVGTRSPARSRS